MIDTTGAVLLYFAINSAVTIATRSAMREQGKTPVGGETALVVVGLLFGWLMLLVAIAAAAKEILARRHE